jgi:hypothetical protein
VVLADDAPVLPHKFPRDERRHESASLASRGCSLQDDALLADYVGRARCDFHVTTTSCLARQAPSVEIECAILADGGNPHQRTATWGKARVQPMLLSVSHKIAHGWPPAHLAER